MQNPWWHGILTVGAPAATGMARADKGFLITGRNGEKNTESNSRW